MSIVGIILVVAFVVAVALYFFNTCSKNCREDVKLRDALANLLYRVDSVKGEAPDPSTVRNMTFTLKRFGKGYRRKEVEDYLSRAAHEIHRSHRLKDWHDLGSNGSFPSHLFGYQISSTQLFTKLYRRCINAEDSFSRVYGKGYSIAEVDMYLYTLLTSFKTLEEETDISEKL